MISEELKNDLKIKWDRMRDGMAKMGMDACLLTVDVNLYYTTGQIYSGYFGYLYGQYSRRGKRRDPIPF